MSIRVVGYTADGHRIVVDEGPAVGRVSGYVAKSSSRGYAVLGGELVQGDPPPSNAANQRAYKARQKAAQA